MTLSAKVFVRVHIRWMIRRDLAEVLEIERASSPDAWDELEFLDQLRRRNCIGMVADLHDQVAGYMIYELGKRELKVLRLVVDPRWRRKGVGAQMVAKLVGKLSHLRRSRIWVHVRESNLAAQLFLRSQRFRAVEIVRECYADTNEDAYVFCYALESLSDPSLGSNPLKRPVSQDCERENLPPWSSSSDPVEGNS